MVDFSDLLLLPESNGIRANVLMASGHVHDCGPNIEATTARERNSMILKSMNYGVQQLEQLARVQIYGK